MTQKNKPNNLIVFLSTGDWEINTSQRFLLAVAKEINNGTPVSIILCVQRPVCLLTSPFSNTKRWLHKITGKSGIKKIEENIYIITPWVILHDIVARYMPFAESVNRWLVGRQIRQATSRLGIKESIIWLCHPYQSAYINVLPESPFIYHCSDAFEEFAPNEILKKRIIHDEIKLLHNAIGVFATSTALVKKCSKINPNVWFIPNGADYVHFAKVSSTPNKLISMSRPFVGFVGKINSKINFKLVNDIAQLKPNWSFIFLGVFDGTMALKKDPDYLLTLKLSNIHYLGFIDYSVLPGYIKAFDVCIIPSVNSNVTNAVYPLKINEYLSSGKPVISTTQPELVPFKEKGLIKFADEPEEFVELIEIEMSTDGPEKIILRQQCAKLNDWRNRAGQLLEHLNSTHYII